MRDADRFRLLCIYRTPRVRIGTVLTCEARDCDVVVTGYTDARIPWPVGRRKGAPARGPVVFGGLAEAVRRESNQAVCYWFGVTPWTASKWRRLLGIKWTNPGTRRLRSDYFDEPWAKRARKKAHAKNSDPQRRRKISEAFKGKPRPPHVIEAMQQGRIGKPHTEEARAKMRAAHARRSRLRELAGGDE